MRAVQTVAVLAVALATAFQVYQPAQASVPTFESLDTNDDGKLSVQELAGTRAARKKSPEHILEMLDSNGDGFVSKEEFARFADRRKQTSS